MLKNLIAAAYSPMNQDQSLKTEVIPDYCEFLKKNKVAGVFMNGSTGDFTSLQMSERKEIVSAWSKCKHDDLFLIDHVGDTSLENAKELATHSADKVDAIAALAPYYFRLNSVDKLVTYCSEIAACAPNLPFYYYHIPVLTGANLDMVEFLKKASEGIPNLAGIKFTSDDLIGFRQASDFQNREFNVLFGFDEIFLAGLSFGAQGWVGSTYNHLAPLYYEIKRLFEIGENETAAVLQEKAIRFVQTLDAVGGFNGAGKGFMKYLGVDCGPSRFPHNTIADETYQEVLKDLESLGLKQWFSKVPIFVK
jgi:N-acetylneuraminate lyase